MKIISLEDYLFNKPSEFCLIDVNSVDSDYVLRDDIEEKILEIFTKGKHYFFKSDLKQDLLDDGGITDLFSLLRSRSNDIRNTCVVVEYKSEDQREQIMDLYDSLNVLESNLFITVKKGTDLVSYAQFLFSLNNVVFSEDNDIDIYPSISFIQYIFNNFIVENFVDKTVSTENLTNPNTPEFIDEILVKEIGLDKTNEIKEIFFRSFTQEDKDFLKNKATEYFNALQQEITDKKEELNLQVK